MRSTAKKRVNTTHSTPTAAIVGNTINAANRRNDRWLAWNASRLVRLDTGNSSDAELARCAHAYTCGLALVRIRAAVANTTGVSSTIVASRLSTAVIAAAITNTNANSRCGLPPATPGHHRAHRVKQPLTPAALGDHQHRRQKTHRRPQSPQRVVRPRKPNRTNDHEQHRPRARRGRL